MYTITSFTKRQSCINKLHAQSTIFTCTCDSNFVLESSKGGKRLLHVPETTYGLRMTSFMFISPKYT